MELGRGESSSIQFGKRKRDPANLFGQWRLATVEEVTKNLQVIKQKRILESQETVRLLDGCVSGPNHKYSISNEYKAHLLNMIVVKTKVSTRSEDPFREDVYSGISLSTEAKKAALLLSCEDKIAEVLFWILRNVENEAELDELNKSIDETFRNGRNILHYAADHPHNGEHGLGIANLLVKKSRFEYGKELLKSKDKYGRTALHLAAFHGHIQLCRFLIKEGELKMNERDGNMENSLHFAANGNKVDQVNQLVELFYSLREEEVQQLILSQGAKGKTALHKAAANGNGGMIEALLSRISNVEEKKGYISKSDWFGETALHEAAREGHVAAIECLLRYGSSPLLERNDDGKTALHYAVQVEDITRAKQIAGLLSDCHQSPDEKTLFLCASATGVGTAEESANKEVREFLQTKTPAAAGSSNNLLRTAIEQGLEKDSWELITRRGDIQQVKDIAWSASLNRKQRQHLDNILQHIDAMPDVGRDQPTGEDSLGRIHFAEGLASLFLNPFVKTPVTVGISGDWGMGKSSLMVQTEIALLKAAAQLAFPNLLQIEKFPGFKEWEFSKSGRRKYEEITKGVKHLLMRSTLIPYNQDEDPLVQLLENYQQQYHDVYRSLAVMDRRQMFHVTGETSQSSTKVDTLGKIPAILTVQYNAWHYQSESEAWAGLAVEITKVIEETMNTAQTIRTCSRYAWNEQRSKIYFVLILPCLLLFFIAGWIAWAAWLLISRSNDKALVRLKYGCIPVTIITIAWTVLRQLFSVMKPISYQIMAYVRLPDHSGNLGYQQKVISDIKFLKAQIGEKPSWVWKFIAGQWCWNWFGLFADTVKDTRIPKLPPAPMDDLRIIVFVDDLDRCQDKVILEVLSAVNLVLAACEINCILGMDQKMIARAIANKFEHVDEKVEDKNYTMDLANRYLTKIIQLPLTLPDPNNVETTNFLYRQLGVELKGRFDEHIDSDEEEDTQIGKRRSQEDINSDAEEEANRTMMTVKSPSDAACHVAVNVGHKTHNERQRPTELFSTFWLKVSQLLQPCRNCFAQLLKSNGTKTPSKFLQGAALNSVLLMSKYYSLGEREALSYLQEFATEYRKLPREWKRFLTYHRLAWNILSKSGQVKSLANWQLQLVVWIFCCWLWKDQMDIIIEKWQEVEFRKEDTLHGKASEGPSLSDIVERHIMLMETTKDKLYYQWMDLKMALSRYDVSMDCIQAFQKFRLHCKVGHLHRIYYGI